MVLDGSRTIVGSCQRAGGTAPTSGSRAVTGFARNGKARDAAARSDGEYTLRQSSATRAVIARLTGGERGEAGSRVGQPLGTTAGFCRHEGRRALREAGRVPSPSMAYRNTCTMNVPVTGPWRTSRR